MYITTKLIKKILLEIKKINRYSSSDGEYWEGLRNKYKGQRGFVIGNGPSLNGRDLDRVESEITIASNKIYLIFNQTNWRPTFYTVADPILWSKIAREACAILDKVHIPNYLSSYGLNNVVRWRSLLNWTRRKVSNELQRGAYGGYTVTFENLQLAMHLGLNPIYLIGCDHNYPGEKGVQAGVPIIQGDEKTHFTREYRNPGEIVFPAPIKRMEQSYSAARLHAEKKGIKIFNATRGGSLEIFQRVDFDDIKS